MLLKNIQIFEEKEEIRRLSMHVPLEIIDFNTLLLRNETESSLPTVSLLYK
jgi:hypothetical protein